MNSSLCVEAIAASAQIAGSVVAIEVIGQTASTNADLLARVGQMPQPTLLAAASQTAGRGRAGRAWLSSPDNSLTFSLAWPLWRPMRELAGLPLAVGVALAETLTGQGVPARLKWPNDLLLEGVKLGGILIETAYEKGGAGQPVWAVIGIGLNLALPQDLRRQIGRPAAALPAHVAQDRNRLLGLLLEGLAAALRQFEREGFAAFMTRWNALHDWSGQAVHILDHGRVVLEGRAAGVDAQGQLLLDTADGRVAVLAGDVSLRKTQEGSANAVAG